MAQTKKVQGTATRVIRAPHLVAVSYHNTTVAKRDDSATTGTVTLNSGGWRTATTKTRMNQFSNEFCNGAFSVYQKAGDWFVAFGHNPGDVTLPFVDGMSFTV